jgi:hypothetical protein
VPKEVIALIAIAATMIPILVIVLISVGRVSKSLVLTEAGVDAEWRLGMMAQQGRKHWLCMRYMVTYQGFEDSFGLVVDYRCRTPEGEIRERAGVGHEVPPERDRYIGTSYSNSYSAVLGSCRQKATVVLATLGPFQYPVELEATGTILVSPGTTLVHAEVYFA